MRLTKLRLAFDKILGYDNTDLNNHLWNWIKEHASEIAELSNSGGNAGYASTASSGVQNGGHYVANLNNITDIHTIKLGDDKIKIVCDASVPKDEFWFVDWDGRTQRVKY